MKLFLGLFLLLFTPLTLAEPEPDYNANKEAVEKEAEAGAKEDVETIELTDEVLIFHQDASSADLTAGFDFGDYNTPLSRQEGSQVLDQALTRAEMAEWHRAKFSGLRSLRQSLLFDTNEVTKCADENTGNCEDDLVTKLNELDEMIHGPQSSSGPGMKKAEPMFAKASSTTLNSAPHPASQQGDPCQGGGDNSAGAQMGAIGAMYPGEGCDIDALAPILDCTLQAIKRINSESKGASCNSTQVMQPTVEPDKQKLQGVSQAQTNSVSFPSCPTSPREAESTMDDVTQLASFRGKVEQNSLVADRTTSALAQTSAPAVAIELPRPWIGRLLARIFPTTQARVRSAVTMLNQTSTTVSKSDIARESFAKSIADLSSYASMAEEQDWAHQMSSMMEEIGKISETTKQETEKINEHWQQIAELNIKPF